MLFSLLFVLVLALYAWNNVDRTKTTVWMVVNMAWLGGMAALSYFDQNVYFGLGLVSAVVSVVRSIVGGQLPVLDNKLTYVKMLFSHVFFWPVEVFESVYGALKDKV
jgi:hypothetical protein